MMPATTRMSNGILAIFLIFKFIFFFTISLFVNASITSIVAFASIISPSDCTSIFYY